MDAAQTTKQSTGLGLLGHGIEVVREAASEVVAAMLEEGNGQPELEAGFLPRIVAALVDVAPAPAASRAASLRDRIRPRRP